MPGSIQGKLWFPSKTMGSESRKKIANDYSNVITAAAMFLVSSELALASIWSKWWSIGIAATSRLRAEKAKARGLLSGCHAIFYCKIRRLQPIMKRDQP